MRNDGPLNSVEQVEAFVQGSAAAALYFSGRQCGVCQVLRPQVEALLRERFPKIVLATVTAEEQREIAAQYGVFSVPTLLIFFEGRETFRYTRNFSAGLVEQDLVRPYSLFFE